MHFDRLVRSYAPVIAAVVGLGIAGVACRDVVGPEGRASGSVVWTVAGRGWAVQPSTDSTTAYFGSIDHTVIAIDKATGRERWRRATGAGGPFTWGHNTVLAPGVVVIDDGLITAFDRATGAPRWQFGDGGDGWLAADGSTVYTGTLDGRVYAINGMTGAERWRTDVVRTGRETLMLHPTVANGVVYVGISDETISTPNGFERTGALVALEAQTGRVVWTHEFTRETAGQYAGCWGGSSVHGTNVIVSIDDGRVFALNRTTGAVVWVAPRVHQLPPFGPYNDIRPLAVQDDIVVVGSTSGVVVGLDARTGRELWRNISTSISVVEDIATDNAAAYVGHSSSMRAYDLRTGYVRWESAAGYETGGYWAPPAIDGDRLYVASNHGFHALRR